tara:strand:+ start:5358 stop:5717 length:360 start_codon:yes stop_codon:yes gene_type:complete
VKIFKIDKGEKKMTNKFKWTSTTIPEIKSAAEELVKSAIKDGWTWDILCDGDYLCKDTYDFDEVMGCIHAVDGPVEAHINHPHEKSDWCNFIMCNGEPDCEVADCYVGGYIDRWLEKQN